MTPEQRVKWLLDWTTQIDHYSEALELMEWDLRTGAPPKGHTLRAEAIGTLSEAKDRLKRSPELEECLTALSAPDVYEQLDPTIRATVRELVRETQSLRKVPADRQKAYAVLVANAPRFWEEAKNNNDFASFQPYLEKIVDMKREFSDYIGYEKHPYDVWLDKFEPGQTVAQLDELFPALRSKTVEILNKVLASPNQPDEAFCHLEYPVGLQREVSLKLLSVLGYDFAAGRLDEAAHPFQTSINRHDNRVTTHFLSNEIRSAVFSTIHECGHALYEQGISDDLTSQPIVGGASMAVHESQSRFLENVIGRSKEFWESNWPLIADTFPAQVQDVTILQFYRAINAVHPSLIRTEADELTYNLHIIVRYELEKQLLRGDLRVADLPEAWRSTMKEYLGVVPKTDTEGVLQDIHWSCGDFGYFPSYSLGNLYAAQFTEKLTSDLPDYLQQVGQGEFGEIREWLRRNIHQYGKLYTPGELVVRVTGKPLDVQPLLTYLETKFLSLYGVS